MSQLGHRMNLYHPMCNGMVERFNQALLNMFKEDWKSYVAPLVHSYNATKHPTTGFSPFFLMFGRHPRLAIDADLGIPLPEERAIVSQDRYTTKLCVHLPKTPPPPHSLVVLVETDKLQNALVIGYINIVLIVLTL